MESPRSGEPTGGQSFGSRLGAVCAGVARRPWLLLGWLALAALVVGAQHWLPQPWSGVAYPVALIVALWLFRRATPGN
ncbi:hypothetical protein [Streptomyces hokutonensis]|uniref:hypothetical protein n=1 Tax=Streptomyces hokutonensis TaxID=1306990 RepID=UPI0037FCB7DE